MSLQGLLSTILSPGNEDQLVKETSTIVSILLSTPDVFSADSQVLHKFQTRISGLLKSRLPNTRWAAMHIARVSVLQSWDVLQSHGATWAGIMQSLLDRPENTIVHYAAIDALGTIFASTQGKPELTRTITTPRIPQYVGSLLNLSKKPELCLPCLQNLRTVLRNQSTTFRPFVGKFSNLLNGIINKAITEPHTVNRELLSETCNCLASLHMSAAKGSEADEWRSQFLGLLREFHATLDLLISPFINEDVPDDPAVKSVNLLNLTSASQDLTSLYNKLEVLVSLIRAFLTSGTKIHVRIPFGSVQILTERVLAVSRLSPSKQSVDKSQQQLFYNLVENLQILIVQLNLDAVPIISSAYIPHCNSLLHFINMQVTVTGNIGLKMLLFELTTELLRLCKTTNTTMMSYIAQIVVPALKLLSPETFLPISSIADSISNPAAFQRSVDSQHKKVLLNLLVLVIATSPDLNPQIRAQIDRVFIVHGDLRGLEISSLYPGLQGRYSIAPLAVQRQPRSTVLSCLIHPRFPPLSQAIQSLERSYRFEEDGIASTGPTSDAQSGMSQNSISNGFEPDRENQVNTGTEYASRNELVEENTVPDTRPSIEKVEPQITHTQVPAQAPSIYGQTHSSAPSATPSASVPPEGPAEAREPAAMKRIEISYSDGSDDDIPMIVVDSDSDEDM